MANFHFDSPRETQIEENAERKNRAGRLPHSHVTYQSASRNEISAAPITKRPAEGPAIKNRPVSNWISVIKSEPNRQKIPTSPGIRGGSAAQEKEPRYSE